MVESSVSTRKWYQDVTLEDAETYILANMKSAVRSVIAIGYYLKCIRDGGMYLDAGYETIWEYAKTKYGFSKSTASRYMERNDKFSVDGNSPIIDEKYREYSKSQLQEMLSLDDEQLEQVSPDMTVKQIREMRKPVMKEIPYYEIPGQLSITDFPGITEEDVQQTENAVAVQEVTPVKAPYTIMPEDFFPEEVATVREDDTGTTEELSEELLSAFGTPRRVYPPDSLIATPGCTSGTGRGFDCFSCHMECGIRGEDCYCVEAPMGNPFPCEILGTGTVEKLKEAVGSRCQFVNLDLAYTRAGDGAPVPCCKECQDPCEFACKRSAKVVATSQQVEVAAESIEEEAEAPTETELPEAAPSEEHVEVKDYDRVILEQMIRETQISLNLMGERWMKERPKLYTEFRMQLTAYRMLMEFHDKKQDSEED